MTAIKTKTTRSGPGYYEVTDGQRTVNVFKVDLWDGEHWLAAAAWNRDIVTDPVPLKRVAVWCAEEMLGDAR